MLKAQTCWSCGRAPIRRLDDDNTLVCKCVHCHTAFLPQDKWDEKQIDFKKGRLDVFRHRLKWDLGLQKEEAFILAAIMLLEGWKKCQK